MKYAGIIFFVVLAGCATVAERTARNSGVGISDIPSPEGQYSGAVVTTTYTN